ncbi:general substrate transporter [Schizophyllum amplum]|uniref:General substrate transporter n=1 Tax=Schizophyllum amplum TaxID=97359 RepID=A0A550CQF8_9AGAR|nr:general substrate transporter [Auriculariopsis ampla]
MDSYGARVRKALHVPRYVRCVCFASLAAYVFGFDTGSIGPITLMDDFTETFGDLSSTVQGLFVSAILIPAAITSFGAGSIADRISRTHTISLGCAIYAMGSLLCAIAGINMSQSSALAMIFVGRCVSGVGEGVFLSAVTVYGIEVAPRKLRGRVGCIMQLFISSGIMIGYFVCYGSLNITGSLSWRLPWVLQCLTCSVTAIGVRFLPHSPRWLLHVGRRDEAMRAMQRLDLSKDEFITLAASEEEEKAQLQAAREKAQRGGFKHHVAQFKQAFAPGLRGRTAMAIFMQSFQQFAGIDGVLYYAPVLFKQAGLSSQSASFLASGVTGIVNVVFTIVGQTVSDKWGRRKSIIWGGIVMATAMTIIGVLYSLPNLSQAGNYAVIALIFVYFIPFVVTWAILIRIWVSEAQPVQTRASVASLSLTANWGSNWIVAFTTPMFLDAYPSGPYFLWGACTWLAVLVFWLYLPETKGQNVDLAGQSGGLKLQVRIPGLRRRRVQEKSSTPPPVLQERRESVEDVEEIV